mmetsp:Transcript_6037/g.15800  ORF Transcript_6037/g.15800 Transcript_6037/m.15800 type:complete len:161 (-) Transcript_6037:20-502(-)
MMRTWKRSTGATFKPSSACLKSTRKSLAIRLMIALKLFRSLYIDVHLFRKRLKSHILSTETLECQKPKTFISTLRSLKLFRNKGTAASKLEKVAEAVTQNIFYCEKAGSLHQPASEKNIDHRTCHSYSFLSLVCFDFLTFFKFEKTAGNKAWPGQPPSRT